MEERPEAQDLDSSESLNLGGICRTRNCSSKSKVQRLKMMVKFAVSVCVLCLVAALFFSLFSLFPHSFTLYFSLFSLLNHALDRNYMFFVCNGILLLLATSPLQHSNSTSHHHHHYDLLEEEEEEEEEEDEEEELEEEEDDDDTSAIHSADLAVVGPTIPLEEEEEDEDEDEDEDEGCFTDEVEEEEEEEEEGKRSEELEVVVSTEELNKKIEEFIRKMKEEMRIQAAAAAAHTQLIN